jgi:RNA polymerase sigma-70 factor (ECF subfamily)
VEDAEVIRAPLAEPARFGVIFDRLAPYIQRYLARRLGQQIADDLVAETFLVAFRRRDRYDLAQPNALPWLYGIATNLLAQHRRDEVRRFRLNQAAPRADVSVGHAERITERVAAQAMRGPLNAALGGLAAPDRDVLLLIAWEQLTYEEVATALGIPIGTVRSRLNRARRKVRAALGELDPTMTFQEVLT